jgi:hypothetical protein
MYYGYNPNLDSPTFTKQPSITAGATVNYDFMFKSTDIEPASKYVPLNYIEIVNNSQSQVILTVKDVVRPIGPSGFLVLNPSDVQGGFYSFSVKNNGTFDIAQGQLIINVQRKGINSDTLIQKIASKIFSV